VGNNLELGYDNLDVLFDWDDVHNEDLYFLHEVFYFLWQCYLFFSF